jgi:glycosyltransferase involved in cell wall biosynthesis
MYSLSIIIPLYNEQSLIEAVVAKIHEINLPEFVHEFEIIIVDDCSSDESFRIATGISQSSKNVSVYRHEKNMGKGAAVRTGIEKSKGNIFLIQDSDLELIPSDIPKMIRCLHELQVEFVNGSRYLAGVNRPLSSYKRYLANRIFTSLTAILINVKITDMACGYKLIHKNLYDKLHLKENRFGFEAELIIKALRIKKNNIAEVPVHYFPRNSGEGKKLKNTDGFKILWTILKFGMFRLN